MCDNQEFNDMKDVLETRSSKDLLRFDLALPLANPDSHSPDVDIQQLAKKIREAICAVVSAETDWRLDGFEILESGAELHYESPFYVERIDYESLSEEGEDSDDD